MDQPGFRQDGDRSMPLSDQQNHLGAQPGNYHSPANDQSFQQTLLPWPQPKLAAELNSVLIPCSNTSYGSTLRFDKALTAGAALATQRLEEPHSNPRQNSGRCVRCWAQRKPVILFIQ